MAADQPPSSVCFSLDEIDQADGDHSELTGSSYYGDYDDIDNNLLSGADRNERATDQRCYLHELDQPLFHANEQDRELIKLKLQIARQQEHVDIIASKLSKCEVENEVLQSEKATLVDELARETHELPPTAPRGGGWLFSKSSSANNLGSMQMLVDNNAKLMMENARVQVLVDIMRKSFQTYIKDSRRTSERDQQTIKALQQENELLQQQQQQQLYSSRKLPSANDLTAKASSLESSFSDMKALQQENNLLLLRKLKRSESDRAAGTGKSISSSSESSTNLNAANNDNWKPVIMEKVDMSTLGKPRSRIDRRFSESENTALTSLESSFASKTQSSSPIPQDAIRNSLHSIPEQYFNQLGISGDDWIIEGEEIETAAAEGNKNNTAALFRDQNKEGRRNSMPLNPCEGLNSAFSSGAVDLLVSFSGDTEETTGAGERRPSRDLTRQHSQSLTDTLSSRKPDELLVDFGETERRRSRSLARRWTSVKW
jgi:hypothetical protein